MSAADVILELIESAPLIFVLVVFFACMFQIWRDNMEIARMMDEKRARQEEWHKRR